MGELYTNYAFKELDICIENDGSCEYQKVNLKFIFN